MVGLVNVAQTVKDLGRKKAVVIHGAGGMDEASLSGDNLIYEVNAGQDIQHYTIIYRNGFVFFWCATF
jgi:anthranilate phosphoribosyltransferase